MDKDEQLLILLLKGFSVSEACRKLKFNYNYGYKIARKSGWRKSLRRKEVCRNTTYGTHHKMTLSEKEVVKRYEQGESQASIARDSNVSREYIRQIVKRNGCKSCQAIREQKKKQKQPYVKLLRVLKIMLKQKKHQAVLDRRYKRDFEKWKQARLWWSQDVPIREMAKRLKIDFGSFNWYIGKMRERYGWFPNRKPFGHHRTKRLTEEKRKQQLLNKYGAIVPHYERGLSQAKIAEKLNLGRGTVAWGIYHLRKELNLCLPKRR